MNQVNTTMSPNQFGAGLAGGGSMVNSAGGLSSASVVEALAKILEKQNQTLSNTLQQAEAGGGGAGGGGAAAAGGAGGAGGAGDTQANTTMLKAQQQAGVVNTTQSIATSVIQGLTDAQKETARATH
jgi:hypothetical protein